MRTNLLEKEKTTRENRIWVRITAACNEKCLFCLDSEAQNGKLVDDDIIKKQIREGYKEGIKNRIIISGGEASIHPKFHHYIAYAKEVGYDHIQTVTNGNMFARPEFCKKAFDAGLQEVTFSLHGHTSKLHDYLTATPGSFDKALKGLIYIRKYYPSIIINIDIVVNKLNVDLLPKIVAFYMRLGVYEFDILQIIPFGRGFSDYKDILFYKIEDHLEALHSTWKLSKLPGVYMWTNRFPMEAFEGYEDLVQDPRKIKGEIMGEALDRFSEFIATDGQKKPDCYGERCDVCFLKQYCHDFLKHNEDTPLVGQKYIIGSAEEIPSDARYIVLRGEEFPSDVYEKFGSTATDFIKKINNLHLDEKQELINVPPCIRSKNNHSLYEWNNDMSQEKNVALYTKNYIQGLYRKKSTRCTSCKYNASCEGIHVNFLRSYGFEILQPITD